MKDKWMVLKKMSICLLTMVVVFSAGIGVGRTGAWFVDAGTWVEASYGIGVIDYTVYMNGQDIEKIKDGQKVSLAIPMVGGAKLGEPDKTVAAVTSTLSGAGISIGAHDEFDEGITLVRTRIVNIGGLPIGIRATVEGAKSGLPEGSADSMTDNGILYMVVPQGAEISQKDYSVTVSGGAVQTYKSYIKSTLSSIGSVNWSEYSELVSAVNAYHNTVSNGVKNNMLVYPGRLPFFKDPATASEAFQVDVLCWAEYDQMPWSVGDAQRNNTKAVEQKSGTLVLTIECTL